MMQAVIMAGGKGTRLASVTKNIPKPMVPLCGKPLLVHQIENLKANGITNIIIIVGYLGDVIKDYFSDGSSFGVNISYFTEEEPLGTAGALRLIQDRLEDNFVLVFGDLYINIDFQRFWNYHIAKKAAVSLFAHPNSHPQDSDILVTNDEMQVTEWSKKNTERVGNYPNLVNAGLYVVSKDALKALPDQKKIDFEKDFILRLIPDRTVYAYHSSEYVKDIGTPERLSQVEQDYENHIPESRNLHHKQKAIFLDRDGTINKYVGFLRRAGDMELEEGAAEAIKLINSSEYLAIVITNQPVIARGEVTFEGLKQIHNRMETLLGEKGAYIDGLYFCPHHPDKGFEGEVPELKINCDCRKPKTGLIKKAVEDFNIDLSQCWIIGDTGMDVQTGINAGIRTALLDTGESDKFKKYQAVPDIRSANLFEAVNTILSGKDHLEMYKDEIIEYYDREIDAIKAMNFDEIDEAVVAIKDAYEREATIYVFGNGGSAATASHMAGDFNKGISEGHEKKFKLVCLSDNIPTLMAIANDISYDEVFSYQLKGHLKPTDLVIAISGSGNSKNVIKAVKYAKEVGTKVVGISGYHGGKLKEMADYQMHVNIDDMQISEDVHMTFDHMMYRVLRDALKNND